MATGGAPSPMASALSHSVSKDSSISLDVYNGHLPFCTSKRPARGLPSVQESFAWLEGVVEKYRLLDCAIDEDITWPVHEFANVAEQLLPILASVEPKFSSSIASESVVNLILGIPPFDTGRSGAMRAMALALLSASCGDPLLRMGIVRGQIFKAIGMSMVRVDAPESGSHSVTPRCSLPDSIRNEVAQLCWVLSETFDNGSGNSIPVNLLAIKTRNHRKDCVNLLARCIGDAPPRELHFYITETITNLARSTSGSASSHLASVIVDSGIHRAVINIAGWKHESRSRFNARRLVLWKFFWEKPSRNMNQLIEDGALPIIDDVLASRYRGNGSCEDGMWLPAAKVMSSIAKHAGRQNALAVEKVMLAEFERLGGFPNTHPLSVMKLLGGALAQSSMEGRRALVEGGIVSMMSAGFMDTGTDIKSRVTLASFLANAARFIPDVLPSLLESDLFERLANLISYSTEGELVRAALGIVTSTVVGSTGSGHVLPGLFGYIIQPITVLDILEDARHNKEILLGLAPIVTDMILFRHKEENITDDLLIAGSSNSVVSVVRVRFLCAVRDALLTISDDDTISELESVVLAELIYGLKSPVLEVLRHALRHIHFRLSNSCLLSRCMKPLSQLLGDDLSYVLPAPTPEERSWIWETAIFLVDVTVGCCRECMQRATADGCLEALVSAAREVAIDKVRIQAIKTLLKAVRKGEYCKELDVLGFFKYIKHEGIFVRGDEMDQLKVELLTFLSCVSASIYRPGISPISCYEILGMLTLSETQARNGKFSGAVRKFLPQVLRGWPCKERDVCVKLRKWVDEITGIPMDTWGAFALNCAVANTVSYQEVIAILEPELLFALIDSIGDEAAVTLWQLFYHLDWSLSRRKPRLPEGINIVTSIPRVILIRIITEFRQERVTEVMQGLAVFRRMLTLMQEER